MYAWVVEGGSWMESDVASLVQPAWNFHHLTVVVQGNAIAGVDFQTTFLSTNLCSDLASDTIIQSLLYVLVNLCFVVMARKSLTVTPRS